MTGCAETARQLDMHLRAPRQVWLTGAGISFEAGLPLMFPLTDRIFQLLEKDESGGGTRDLIKMISDDLPIDLHIEHVLSHFGDLIALAERSKDKKAAIGTIRVHKIALQDAHHTILRHIRDILRWGYRPANDVEPEQIGNKEKPIVNIEHHRRFIRSLYKVNRAGLDDRRDAVHFVTTNYDTLLEDALALELVPYGDGFVGGAIASWDEQALELSQQNSRTRALITKLHGSIDWYRSGAEAGRVFRVRHDDLYPDRSNANGNVVIYPQSTKYMATREDPFGFLFERFRRLLANNRQQVLFTCGYSFGDDHIDAIIEQSLLHPDNKTTLVAFSKSRNAKLQRWGSSSAGNRIFVITEDGLYRGPDGPFFGATSSGAKRDWWSFSGATSFLEDGLPADVAEQID
ncbi:SIR2 family protein [Kaistia defluvii]|uniref:SIR2-like domain-containing protein n=1 Tax=Kaistia defluvii TaxID=410841 RepID=A0ABV2QV77_9HYPH